jgi:excisionase family DNA binding protein
MKNPFEIIDERLNNIENLLLDIKHKPVQDSGKTEQEDQLLNVQETASFLDLTVPTIYSKASRGELPFMKRSKRIYFSKNDLMEYLKVGRRKTNDEISMAAEEHLKRLEGK